MAEPYAVILAGGRGERFWPWSTPERPKQFLPLLGLQTLLQQTAERIRLLLPWDRIFVSADRSHASLITDQLPALPPDHLILEPRGRNTAPGIALASLYLERHHADAVMVVLPADHYIPSPSPFLDALRRGLSVLEVDPTALVTFGVRPTRPETGYGYIQRGAERHLGAGVYGVEKFTEKPDQTTAARMLTTGDYYWNSGIFLWTVPTLHRHLAHLLPELWEGLVRIREAWGREEVVRDLFDRVAPLSIDYGILEKAEGVVVIPCEFAWDDLGSWDALGRVLPQDGQGNVVCGKHTGIDTEGCVILSSGRPVGTIGVSRLLVVETEEGILVCARDRAQEVRQLMEKMGKGR